MKNHYESLSFLCGAFAVIAGSALGCTTQVGDEAANGTENTGTAAQALETCDSLFAYYNNSSWWWGAFGNCKTGPGGTTDRAAILDCAWSQVPPSHRSDCLKGKLGLTPQTSQAIDVVAAYNSPSLCVMNFNRYDNSSWWWGAFGNCKAPSGTTDRGTIFECAWAQVPASDRSDCLKEMLRTTAQTSQGIDAVVAFNTPPTCDELFARYNNSSWWWGAFGGCKVQGGTTNRGAIFTCAWQQVPVADRTDCLKAALLQTPQTSQGIDSVVAYNYPEISVGGSYGPRRPPLYYTSGPSVPKTPIGSTTPCPGGPGGQEQSFTFDLTCVAGGASSTTSYPGMGCTQAQARERVVSMVSASLMQGCTLYP